MTKLYFTYGSETREGFDSILPGATAHIPADSVEEIQGENVLEKVPSLIAFIDECYRLLKPDAKAIFSAPHYASTRTWMSPLTVRAIGEHSLNFCSRDWRELNKYTETTVLSNFQVDGQVAIEQSYMQRSEEARGFAVGHYLNVAQALLFTLTKKPLT